MGPCASSFAAGASRSASCSHPARSQRARSASGVARAIAHADSSAATRSMWARRSGVTTAQGGSARSVLPGRADRYVVRDSLSQYHVVDEPGAADPGGYNHDRLGVDAGDGMELRVDEREVFARHARRRQDVQASALEGSRVGLTTTPCLLHGAERARQRERRAAVVALEVDVARREGEPVELAYRGRDLDVAWEIEVGRHASHEHRLLKILAAEDRNVRLDQMQQHGDDREHYREMPWSSGPFERVGHGPAKDAHYRV